MQVQVQGFECGHMEDSVVGSMLYISFKKLNNRNSDSQEQQLDDGDLFLSLKEQPWVEGQQTAGPDLLEDYYIEAFHNDQ